MDLFDFDSIKTEVTVDAIGFKESLVKKLQHRLLSPDEVVISRGDIGHELYFILDGVLGVYEGGSGLDKVSAI